MNTLDELRAGKLAGATRVDLSCGLAEFPHEVFDLADSLEVLNLSGNALHELPDDLGRLKKLRILFCSNNRFTHLPAVLGECESLGMIGFKANQIEEVSPAAFPSCLRWLILTDNRIQSLPASLGRCTEMQKLMLAGNRLSALPNEMQACTKLELLRLAANEFLELPAWLSELPRLAWLAFAGNPCSQTASAPAIDVPWRDLKLEQKLGEGASGEIHRAVWRNEAVAVKVFKGTMASDGLPQCEMDASLAIGQHPNLIPVKAKLSDHPLGALGLVMSLIDPSCISLAGPPSFQSCTRDIYPEELRFTPAEALQLARGVASAAQHLHERGYSHGDLYAHNILWDRQGRCLLGDLGAASFFGNGSMAAAIQRIETRAFGFLLEELLDRTIDSASASDSLEALRRLQADCSLPDVLARPTFGEISTELHQFSIAS
jgi:hypothetical protein